jgi:hypothetical protein
MTIVANPQRGWIPVELDRQRILIFDHKATWLLMEKYGPYFLSELYEVERRQDADGNPAVGRVRVKSIEAFEYFLYAGLQRDAAAQGQSLRLEHVQEWIIPTNIAPLFEALLKALAVSSKGIAERDAGKEKNGEAAAEPPALVEKRRAHTTGTSPSGLHIRD